MATKYSVGHAMRRRSGVSSSPTFEGNTMRTHKTAEEHLGAAASAGSHRVSVGASDVYAASATPALQGTLVPKKNVQAGDPTAGGKANRQNIEVIGASYRVAPKTTFVQLDPAAGPTMANARIIQSVSGRSNPNFDSGIQASSL
jgi:hypothetical protein